MFTHEKIKHFDVYVLKLLLTYVCVTETGSTRHCYSLVD